MDITLYNKKQSVNNYEFYLLPTILTILCNNFTYLQFYTHFTGSFDLKMILMKTGGAGLGQGT